MNDEISYLLKTQSEEIISVAINEALKDLKITAEEQILIDGIKQDLKAYEHRLPRIDSEYSITKSDLHYFLMEQRNNLKELVSRTYHRAKSDGIISEDELRIYRAILLKVDEIIATKISMFFKNDFDQRDSNILVLHKKIGELFSNLSASIIMDMFSKNILERKLSQKQFNDIIADFSSGEKNKEFVVRFTNALKKLISVPMNDPTDLMAAMDYLIENL